MLADRALPLIEKPLDLVATFVLLALRELIRASAALYFLRLLLHQFLAFGELPLIEGFLERGQLGVEHLGEEPLFTGLPFRLNENAERVDVLFPAERDQILDEALDRIVPLHPVLLAGAGVMAEEALRAGDALRVFSFLQLRAERLVDGIGRLAALLRGRFVPLDAFARLFRPHDKVFKILPKFEGLFLPVGHD